MCACASPPQSVKHAIHPEMNVYTLQFSIGLLLVALARHVSTGNTRKSLHALRLVGACAVQQTPRTISYHLRDWLRAAFVKSNHPISPADQGAKHWLRQGLSTPLQMPKHTSDEFELHRLHERLLQTAATRGTFALLHDKLTLSRVFCFQNSGNQGIVSSEVENANRCTPMRQGLCAQRGYLSGTIPLGVGLAIGVPGPPPPR